MPSLAAYLGHLWLIMGWTALLVVVVLVDLALLAWLWVLTAHACVEPRGGIGVDDESDPVIWGGF